MCGWIHFEEDSNGAFHRKDYTQRLLFESPLKFIQRLCKKADKLNAKDCGDIKDSHSNFELNVSTDNRRVVSGYEILNNLNL